MSYREVLLFLLIYVIIFTYRHTYLFLSPHLSMTNRDVVLSACGLVLGVALGASSILYAQEVAYSGVPVEAAREGHFRAAPTDAKPEEYKRRSVKEIFNAILPRARKASRPSGEYMEAAPEVVEDTALTVCGTLDGLEESILSTIPNQFDDIAVRDGISVLFAGTREEWCPQEEAASVEEAVEAKKVRRARVDNNCDEYGPRRAAQCRVHELNGQRWEPTQRD